MAEEIRNGQSLEGVVSDLLSLSEQGSVLVANLVIDFSVDELREKPGIEKFTPAGGDELSFLVEINVVGDSGAYPEDDIFRG